MLAIKSGDSGEGKLKKYDTFSTEISSADGTMDVAKLVSGDNQKATPVPEPLDLQAKPVKRDVSPASGVGTPPDSAPCDQSQVSCCKWQ